MNAFTYQNRRARVGAATIGLPLYPDTIVADITDVASEGNIQLGLLTANLLDLGYTAAQISQLYNNVKSTSTTTPQILDYLQRENSYLQQNYMSNSRLWMFVLLGGGALLLLTDRRR